MKNKFKINKYIKKTILNKNLSNSFTYNKNKYIDALNKIEQHNNKLYCNKSYDLLINDSNIKLKDWKKVNPHIILVNNINNLLDKVETKDYYNKYLKEKIIKKKIKKKEIKKIEETFEINLKDKKYLDLKKDCSYLFIFNKTKLNGYLKIGILIRIWFKK